MEEFQLRDDLLANTLKYLSSVHVPSKRKNVCIISAPRSGSTWLMELILTQPGFRPCDEPCNLRKRAVARRLGINDWSQLFDDSQLGRLGTYLRAFVENRYSAAFKNLRPGQKYYRPITNRVVFKVLHCCEHQVDWLCNTLNAYAVLMIRHPIPVSLSRDQLPRLQAFLGTAFKELLSERQRIVAAEVMGRNERMEMAILDWCLQNVLPLEKFRDSLTVVTYEQLVLDPIPALSILAQRLHLNSVDRMLATLERPSGSVSKSNAETARFFQAVEPQTKKWLVDKWRSRVSEEQEERLMQIVADFGIGIYKAGDVLPSKEYWL